MTIKKIVQYRNIILILTWIFYSAIYIGRLNLSIAAPIMENANRITTAGIGVMGSLFFFSYAIGQIINGRLGDIVSPRIIIFLGLMLSAISNFIISISALPVFLVCLFWAVNGFSQSMLWGPIMRLTAFEFPEEKKCKNAAMFLSTSVGFGGIAAIIIATVLSNNGYSPIFLIPSLILFFFGATAIFVLPKKINKKPQNELERANKKNKRLFSLLLDKRFSCLLFPIFAHGFIKDNLNLWLPSFFLTKYGIDLQSMAFYIFLIPFATLIGRLVYPVFYKIFGSNEFRLTSFSFSLSVCAIIPVLIFDLPLWLGALCFCVLSLLISVINASFLCIFPLRFKDDGNVSTASGLSDFLTYSGAALGSVLSGILAENLGFDSIIVCWLVLAFISCFFNSTSIFNFIRRKV